MDLRELLAFTSNRNAVAAPLPPVVRHLAWAGLALSVLALAAHVLVPGWIDPNAGWPSSWFRNLMTVWGHREVFVSCLAAATVLMIGVAVWTSGFQAADTASQQLTGATVTTGAIAILPAAVVLALAIIIIAVVVAITAAIASVLFAALFDL